MKRGCTMNKLRSKKGFTMVELIVVIAIIGILMAMILPSFMSSGKPQMALAKSESFYYGLHKAMVDTYRLNSPEKTSEFISFQSGPFTHTVKDGDYLYLGVKCEKNRGFTELSMGALNILSPGVVDLGMNYNLATSVSFSSHELLDALNNFTVDEDDGYYYAIVDGKCRVKAVYWSEVPIGELEKTATNEILFTDNEWVGGYVVGAFPPQYSGVNRIMFEFDM